MSRCFADSSSQEQGRVCKVASSRLNMSIFQGLISYYCPVVKSMVNTPLRPVFNDPCSGEDPFKAALAIL